VPVIRLAACPVHSAALSHLLDGQAAGRKRAEKLRFGGVSSSHASQSERSSTTICRLWMGATSGPGSVVSSVKASPVPSGIGRQRPAKQNQSSPALVNFHFDLGGSAAGRGLDGGRAICCR
jgi:hypothetical protein